MIKKYLMTYLINAKYLLVSMGIIYLFIIVVAYVFTKQAIYLYSKISLDTLENLRNYLIYTIKDVAVFDFFTTSYIEKFNEDVRTIINADINNIDDSIMIFLYVATFIIVLSITLSMSACKFFMRKDSNTNKKYKAIISFMIRMIVSFVSGFLFVFFSTRWIYSIYLIIILYSAFLLAENVIETYIIYFSYINFKTFIGYRNIINLLGIYLSIILIHSFILFIIYLLLGKAMFFLILLPFYPFTFALLDFFTIFYYKGKATEVAI